MKRFRRDTASETSSTNTNCGALSKHQACISVQLPTSLCSLTLAFFGEMRLCVCVFFKYVSARTQRVRILVVIGGPNTKQCEWKVWVCLGSALPSYGVQTRMSRWKTVQRGVNWKNIAKTFSLSLFSRLPFNVLFVEKSWSYPVSWCV